MKNNTTKTKRSTLTITLSERAVDDLTALTMFDMRSKSHEIEYLILSQIERLGLDPYKRSMSHTEDTHEQ